MPHSITMQLNPTSQTPIIGRPFKHKRKREAIQNTCSSTHFDECNKRIPWGIGFSEASNDSVVHENIWVWEVMEESASVVKCIGY